MLILPMEPIQPLTLRRLHPGGHSQLSLPSTASARQGRGEGKSNLETGWKRNASPEALPDLAPPWNILGLFISLLTRVEASGLDSIFKH